MSLPVAVVVVTWNSATALERCLRSLDSAGEIVVVDNASVDETRRVCARFGSRVRLVANPVNRGFAGAANQGVLASSAEAILFLNPDAELVSDLRPMLEELKQPGIGAVGGRLIGPDDRTQVGFNLRRLPGPAALACEVLLVNRVWPANPVNRHYRCLALDYTERQDVEQPAGAFLLVRREALELVGGFDERFFPLWFEDVDLCRRIRQAGYRVRYAPEAVARHRGAHSLERISLEQRQIYWYGNLLHYVDKHFPPWARGWVRACVVGGALMRTILALGWGGQWRVYAKIMGFALGRSAAAARQVQPHVLT